MDVLRAWLWRNRKGLWYSARDIPADRIRRVLSFAELAGEAHVPHNRVDLAHQPLDDHRGIVVLGIPEQLGQRGLGGVDCLPGSMRTSRTVCR
jgi:hypothetical protein